MKVLGGFCESKPQKPPESNPEAEQNEKLRQQKIFETFRDGHFEDIVARSDVKVGRVGGWSGG